MRQSSLYFKVTKQIGKLVKSLSSGLSLDAGCGTGAYLNLFKGDHIIALNITLSLLKKIHPSEKISLLLEDIRFLPLKDEVFNFVLCSDVLEYLTKSDAKIASYELERVCANEGKIVISVPSSEPVVNLLRKLIKLIYKKSTKRDFGRFLCWGLICIQRRN